MAKSDDQKLKILYIRDYLERCSHENHPVSTAELLVFLDSKGISCERKTIYRDIAALQEYGLDIVQKKGKSGGYYIATRNFELPELKLLVDAVQSSRFLTAKKSMELIQKFCSQCSHYEEELMRRDILVSGRVKSMNESIYYNVDAIQDAISKNMQITFRYFDWGIDRERHYRPRAYTASPYSLCWADENYYLLAYSQRHGVTHYRVDRMAKIQSAEEHRIPCPQLTGKALTEYANQVFLMFAGEPVSVRMRFHNSLINVVIDRFGRDAILVPDGEEHFCYTGKIAVSPMFLSWIIGFGEKAKILYPDAVIDACRQLCQEAMAQYDA